MYEKYRTKALSKRVPEPDKDQEGSEEVSMQFLQSKEEEIKKEKESVMEVGMRVQREIEQRKLEIQAKEELLRELEVGLLCDVFQLMVIEVDLLRMFHIYFRDRKIRALNLIYTWTLVPRCEGFS